MGPRERPQPAPDAAVTAKDRAMSDCPAPDELLALLGTRQSQPPEEHLEAHLDGCATCRGVLAELARMSSASTPGAAPFEAVHPLPRGAQVARYLVVEL